MTLNPEQIRAYDRDGFLVVENFVDESACDSLRARAEELVRDFDPAGVVSIFSTHEQTRSSDDYFLESGDKIRFFFEEDAFLPDGSLKQSKERSINKVGHAMVIPAIRKTTGSNVRPRCLSAVSTNIIPAR